MCWKTRAGSAPMVMPESAPCSMVVSSAAPRPLPETSAIRKAVRVSSIGNTSK